jgi:RNA polymerase sigma-70 factor (ECF subfamily)
MATSSSPFATAPPADSETALAAALAGCARRERSALLALHELASPLLHADQLQLLGDPDESAAALAQCLLRVWREAARFPSAGCRAWPWLRGLARAVAVDRLAERGRELPPEEIDAQLRFIDAVATEDGSDDLPAGGLAKLSAEDLRALRLTWRSGYPLVRIASALGLPEALLRRQLHRALATLGGAGADQSELLAAGYVLGLQTVRVRARLAARLSRQPALRRQVATWQQRLAVLGDEPPSVRPPEAVWHTVQQTLGEAERGAQGARRGLQRWLLPGMMLALLIALLWLVRGR